MRPEWYRRTYNFAAQAHKGQKRKYTEEPYINHPVRVALILEEFGYNDPDIIRAALTHDVVEDTEVTRTLLRSTIGTEAYGLVMEVTNPDSLVDGPSYASRKARTLARRIHVAEASDRGQFIKVADVHDNTRELLMHDKRFAKVYIPEKILLLDVLSDTVRNTKLWQHVRGNLERLEAKL